jgi:hypothetical protein
MTCFEIVLAYPLQERQVVNLMNEKRVNQLCKYYSADFRIAACEEGNRLIKVRVCDMDAVGLLHDMPSGVYCVYVEVLHDRIPLYSNYKATHTWLKPPRELILKKVYWAATKLEREFI